MSGFILVTFGVLGYVFFVGSISLISIELKKTNKLIAIHLKNTLPYEKSKIDEVLHQ